MASDTRQGYSERPNIETVVGKRHEELGSSWTKLKQAHFQFVAQLLELYSDSDLYFLARDSELLHDAAILVADQSELPRIHLLNVSRANMRDPNLGSYLEQEGISEAALLAGKKVVFIDTGFAGTIPEVIGSHFSDKAREKIKTHLIVSSVLFRSSSRTFLAPLNPAINTISPQKMHSTIIAYEHMARMTFRSDRFEKIDGILVPTGTLGKADDGSVNSRLAKSYMEDLKWSAHQTETQLGVNSDRAHWKKWLLLLRSSDISREEKIRKVKLFLRLSPKSEFIVRDIIDAQSNINIEAPITETEIGLQVQDKKGIWPSKLELAKKFPDWKPILENPETEIPKAFAAGDFHILGAILDVLADAEIDKIVAIEIGKPPYTKQKIALLEVMVDSKIPNESGVHRYKYLGEYVYKNLPIDQFSGLFEKAINHAWSKDLLGPVFTNPLTVHHRGLVEDFIKKGQYYLEELFDLWKNVELTDMHFELVEFGLKNAISDTPKYEYMWANANSKLVRTLLSTRPGIKHTDLLTRALQAISGEGWDYQSLPEFLNKIASLNLSRDEHLKILRIVIENASDHSVSLTFDDGKTRKIISDHILLLSGRTSYSIRKTKSFINWLKSGMAGYPIRADFTYLDSEPWRSLKLSLDIENPVRRKEFLDSKLGVVSLAKKNDSRHDYNLSRRTNITPLLISGQIVEIEGESFEILQKAGDGKRGVVFKVRSLSTNTEFALKVGKNESAETLASLKSEKEKSRKLEKLGLLHSKVVKEGANFVLKSWVDGITGEEVKKRLIDGNLNYREAKKKLLELVSDIQLKSAYIGDFRPPNLIWNGENWIIVDTGSVLSELNATEVLAHWHRADERGPVFERRWGIKLSVKETSECLRFYKP